LIIPVSLLAKNSITLPDIALPRRMAVNKTHLYILEASNTLFCYSLLDGKLKFKVCRKGAGPQELQYLPILRLYPDYVFLGTTVKYIRYSLEGKMEEEKKMPRESVLVPAGNQFVLYIFSFVTIPQGYGKIIIANLVNKKFQKIKEIYRSSEPESGSFIISGGTQRGKIKIVENYFWIHAVDGKLFICDSSKGFYIDVFDYNGNHLYLIKKNFPAVKITSKQRNALIEDYKIKSGFGDRWKQIASQNDIVFPETLPCMERVFITDNHIYVRTYVLKDRLSEYIILDYSGNILKKTYLPSTDICTIKNGKFYYLLENEEEETWELHIKNID